MNLTFLKDMQRQKVRRGEQLAPAAFDQVC